MTVEIITGDCRDVLRTLPAESVHCVVTSPPYFGLRDYGVEGQMGLEPTPAEFVDGMVAVFREVRRVLRSDGTLWLNIGDSYSTHAAGKVANPMAKSTLAGVKTQEVANASSRAQGAYRKDATLPEKNLIGIPWRCTKSHEYLFLLSKSERYAFDADAIAEPLAAASVARLAQDVGAQVGSDRVPGKTNGRMKAVAKGNRKTFRGGGVYTQGRSFDNDAEVMNDSIGNEPNERGVRNKRSVWTVATQPFKEAHFATFPPALVEPCILAGSPVGGTVLDPFGGAGTTGLVADRLQRNAILIELNPAYAEIARRRIYTDAGMFGEIA